METVCVCAKFFIWVPNTICSASFVLDPASLPMLKINIDGSYLGKIMSKGVIVRDDGGYCISWIAKNLRRGSNNRAEFLALKEALCYVVHALISSSLLSQIQNWWWGLLTKICILRGNFWLFNLTVSLSCKTVERLLSMFQDNATPWRMCWQPRVSHTILLLGAALYRLS